MSNRERVERVATKIAPLCADVTFVGGAIAEFYVTRAVSESVRVTTDTDIVSNMTTYSEYHQELGAQLRHLGFRQDAGDPPYRWRDDQDILDVLSLAQDVLGFTNPWYADGVNSAVDYELQSGLVIRLLPPVYYLASKIVAYQDRGGGDPYASPDFEDIVYLMANRPEIFSEISEVGGRVSGWVSTSLRELFPPSRASELIAANLVTGSTGDVVEDVVGRLSTLP